METKKTSYTSRNSWTNPNATSHLKAYVNKPYVEMFPYLTE
jgi:hypothetical protein